VVVFSGSGELLKAMGCDRFHDVAMHGGPTAAPSSPKTTTTSSAASWSDTPANAVNSFRVFLLCLPAISRCLVQLFPSLLALSWPWCGAHPCRFSSRCRHHRLCCLKWGRVLRLGAYPVNLHGSSATHTRNGAWEQELPWRSHTAGRR
jgi:hypothetical protein